MSVKQIEKLLTIIIIKILGTKRKKIKINRWKSLASKAQNIYNY